MDELRNDLQHEKYAGYTIGELRQLSADAQEIVEYVENRYCNLAVDDILVNDAFNYWRDQRYLELNSDPPNPTCCCGESQHEAAFVLSNEQDTYGTVIKTFRNILGRLKRFKIK